MFGKGVVAAAKIKNRTTGMVFFRKIVYEFLFWTLIFYQSVHTLQSLHILCFDIAVDVDPLYISNEIGET